MSLKNSKISASFSSMFKHVVPASIFVSSDIVAQPEQYNSESGGKG